MVKNQGAIIMRKKKSTIRKTTRRQRLRGPRYSYDYESNMISSKTLESISVTAFPWSVGMPVWILEFENETMFLGYDGESQKAFYTVGPADHWWYAEKAAYKHTIMEKNGYLKRLPKFLDSSGLESWETKCMPYCIKAPPVKGLKFLSSSFSYIDEATGEIVTHTVFEKPV